MNSKMLACGQLCLLFLLFGVIKCTIAFNPKLNKLNNRIDMIQRKFRRENDELNNNFVELKSDLEHERYRNDELERKLNETLNNVKGISSGSQNVPNVETLVQQIDTEKKRNNKQAEQIGQQKEQIELLDYQLKDEKAKRSLLEATIEAIRIKCDVTETNEALINDQKIQLNEMKGNLSHVVKVAVDLENNIGSVGALLTETNEMRTSMNLFTHSIKSAFRSEKAYLRNLTSSQKIDNKLVHVVKQELEGIKADTNASLADIMADMSMLKVNAGNVSIQITGVEDKLDNHITSVTEMLNVVNSSINLVKSNLVENERALNELNLCCSNLSSDVKGQDCKFGDQTCAMTTEDGSGSMERCEGNQGMKQVLLGRSVKSQTRVNVKSDDDTRSPFISGSTVMSNGYIVLCDRNTYKLKLLDSSLNIKDSLTLSSRPWDVSTIDNTSVIVTLPLIRQLQFIQVVPNLKAGRIIQLDKKCYGIVVARDRMYVSCRTGSSGEVRILHMNGTMLKQLGGNQDGSIMFTAPIYIAVSPSCDKVFVSDYSTETITCMTVTGQILYQYKADDLRYPSGMYCDGGDNIFICDSRSHTVQVITAEGKKHGDLVTSADGVWNPYSISYRLSDNTLIIGLYNSKDMMRFILPNRRLHLNTYWSRNVKGRVFL